MAHITPDHRQSVRLAATLLSITLIIAILYCLQTVLVPLMFSIVVAITLYPVARFLERIRLGKAFAAIVAVILGFALLFAVIWFIIHQVMVIGTNGTDLQTKFTSIFETIQQWINNQFGIKPNEQMDRLTQQGNDIMSNAGTYLAAAFGSIGGILGAGVLVPIFSFFLLYYRVFFREFFFRAFSSTPKEKVDQTLNKIYDVVQSYLLGLLTVMGIVAILNSVGLWVMGVEYAWFFGTLASLLMLLPYIGIAIGSILPAVFALATKDSYWYAIGVVAWFQVVQFLEANIITPNIVGSKVSINPLMAIIAIILGGMLFGMAGLILALPFTATLKVLLDATPETQPYGFVIGEPEKKHLKRFTLKAFKGKIKKDRSV
jgi:predicted PurR-regulated permease PerM